MKNSKNGFTLMEILLVLMLTGLMAVLFITIVQPFQPKYKTLYYAAIQAVSKVNRELIAGQMSQKIDVTDSEYCQFWTDTVNAINSQTTAGCGTTYSATIASPYGNIDPNTSAPNIVLSNSMKIFFSARQVLSATVNYRVVTVDINGTAKPGKLGEDYVSFLVPNDGSVVPLGAPADDNTHVSASISVYNEATDGTRTFVNYLEDAGKRFMPYRKAFCLAGLNSDAYPTYCNGYSTSPDCGVGKYCMVNLQKELIDIKF